MSETLRDAPREAHPSGRAQPPRATVQRRPGMFAQEAVWEDFIDVFYAPARVLRRRRFENPLLAFTIYCGLSLVLFFALRSAFEPILDAEVVRSLAHSQATARISAGQAERALATARRLAPLASAASAILGPPLLVLSVAQLVWVVGWFGGARLSVGRAIMVVTYASVPRLVGMLCSGVIALLADPGELTSQYRVSLSLARFLPADASPLTLAAFGRVDLFTIWATGLIALGFHVTGRAPPRRAMLAAFTVWALASACALLGALMS